MYPIFCFYVFFFDGQQACVAFKDSSFSCLLTGIRKTPKESVKMFQLTDKEKWDLKNNLVASTEVVRAATVA